MVKFSGNPILCENGLMNRMNTEWNVPIVIILAAGPVMSSILERISPAAFLVNVRASIRSGLAPLESR